MLNTSGKSGHSCLVLDLRGNAFSFSPVSMMLAVEFVTYGLYDVKMFLLCPLSRVFLS